MQGLMMHMPLLISSVLQHAERHHPTGEIVSRRTEGDIHRTNWGQIAKRAKKLANRLIADGVQQGENVATLAWNGYRHVEIYYAVSGMGAVVHTLNPRLFPEQLVYIINHAKDTTVFFDTTFAPLIKAIAPACPTVKRWVQLCDEAVMPADPAVAGCLNYEAYIAQASDVYDWPELDENAACGLCYTSGTTGNPKGALYSHRSTVLHAMAACTPDALGISSRDTVLPVVPMFHVNAWGLPYIGAMVGAKMVMPGGALDGESIYKLMEAERVNISAGVPTVWLGLLNYVQQHGLKFSTFNRTVIGGSAAPPAMIKTLNSLGVEVIHAWGMTELSPLGTVCRLKAKHMDMPLEAQQKVLEKQGVAIYGVDMKIVNDEGDELPWDGQAFGDLLVRGHWVVGGYFGGDGKNAFTVDKAGKQWFSTGDVSKIDPDGYMQITDRSKDVIKSGGEWISSIDLENVAMGHPAVQEAAVISAFHPKWDERPLLVVVRKPNAEVGRDELLKFYDGKVAKWSIPDDVAFVEELPHTATGKIQKLKLREQFKDYKLPG
ncbi:3-(methylthio)propionyl-CoA ligase [Limnobacter humi]|uniref:3-(Methylthio)propionyl-CoA ligase n=1 Tax=Limnobacter humi TaxID=1778671 RepID=A0ABT1WEJ9_9BURK|nr:3-(methylthio)propionyl-CoA ligase [Limnobacter humi]MCQ8895945.1 3-(methylthio)propionyl-CoA ligase [Limnobacter humi]